MAPLQCGLNTSLETPPLLPSWQKGACQPDEGVTQPSECVTHIPCSVMVMLLLCALSFHPDWGFQRLNTSRSAYQAHH